MKALFAAICVANTILVAGCADPLEKPLVQEAGEKFQRGITGHGTLGPAAHSDDSTLQPNSQHP